MMGSAQQEAISRKTCPCRASHSAAKGHNVADGRLLLRPKGATPIRQLRVAGLEKGVAIPCGLRLDLAYWGGSEPVIITLKDY